MNIFVNIDYQTARFGKLTFLFLNYSVVIVIDFHLFSSIHEANRKI